VSTKRKRNYGPIRRGEETSAGTNEAVFAKFFGSPPSVESEPRPESAPPLQSEPRPDIELGTKSTPPVQNVRRPKSERGPESEPTRGFLQLTNHFLFDLMPTLKPSDSVVLLYLLARSHGWRKVRIEVSLNEVGNACHVSRSQARVSLNLLDSRKLIKIITKNGERGYVIDVLVPRADSGPRTDFAPRPGYVPIKERRTYKRTVSKETAPPSPEDLAEYERARRELEGKG